MTAYFKLTSGPVYAVVAAFILKDIDALQALRDWIKKHKLPVISHCGHSLMFEDNYVPGSRWKRCKRGWVPRKRTPAGKELYKSWEALPSIPSGMELLMRISELVGSRNIMRVNQTGTPGCKMRKKTVYLAIDPYWLPADRKGMKEITATEYEKA